MTGDMETVLNQLRTQAATWRAAAAHASDERALLSKYIIEAKDAGHSFQRIRDVTGLGIGTIQTVLIKAGKL